MKIKFYSPSNLGHIQKCGPRLIIYFKAGVFILNKMACNLLGLVEGDHINLGCDPDFPEDWFIKIYGKDDSDSFLLREFSQSKSALAFYSYPLARLFQDSFKDIDSKSISIRIAPIPIKNKLDKNDIYWEIITASLKTKKPS